MAAKKNKKIDPKDLGDLIKSHFDDLKDMFNKGGGVKVAVKTVSDNDTYGNIKSMIQDIKGDLSKLESLVESLGNESTKGSE